MAELYISFVAPSERVGEIFSAIGSNFEFLTEIRVEPVRHEPQQVNIEPGISGSDITYSGDAYIEDLKAQADPVEVAKKHRGSSILSNVKQLSTKDPRLLCNDVGQACAAIGKVNGIRALILGRLYKARHKYVTYSTLMNLLKKNGFSAASLSPATSALEGLGLIDRPKGTKKLRISSMGASGWEFYAAKNDLKSQPQTEDDENTLETPQNEA